MTTFLQCFHLIVDVLVCATAGLALYQWRWWMIRCSQAEKLAADSMATARHFHERLQTSLRAVGEDAS